MNEPKTGHRGSELATAENIVNDFSITVATVNGTGSQTSNQAILRALLGLGIPTTGKNIFPSNIQGAPAWYYIRLSRDGYVARRSTSEILVAFNQATFHRDVSSLPQGGVCIYNGDWRERPKREDITVYSVPVNQFVQQTDVRGKLRDYVANMVYVGALSQLLGIPLEQLENVFGRLFEGNPAAAQRNLEVVKMAHEWTVENIAKTDPYRVQPMDAIKDQIVITGNEAAALGAVFGGVTLAAWYPITPSTSLVDALNVYLPRLRRDPETGKATYTVIQAEDELAAIGMVLGAGWAGARAMTATSGPGISLMAEFIGMGYFAEIPAVIWDIQRVGPSTGLPTRTSQGDVLFTYYLGHGDTKHVILFPGTVAECFKFGISAFDLADVLQTPIFVLSDLDLGMNHWTSDPFDYPGQPINRGKVLSANDLQKFSPGRYEDIDGDGIGYRTLPGNEHPRAAWLARGTGHNEVASYSERPEDLQRTMDRLGRKFETARTLLPAPIIEEEPGAEIGIIAYGTSMYAIEEARDRLAADGKQTSFLRLRGLPINEDVKSFVSRYGSVCVIEQNHEGQVHKILQSELPQMAAKLVSICGIDGLPLTADWVEDRLSVQFQRQPVH